MKRSAMRTMSAKRRQQNRQRRAALHARFGPNPRCQLGPALTDAGVDICRGPACDGHEILTRGRGGSITDADNVLPACRPCHRWVTEHPIDAAVLGLVTASWATS